MFTNHITLFNAIFDRLFPHVTLCDVFVNPLLPDVTRHVKRLLKQTSIIPFCHKNLFYQTIDNFLLE